MCNAWNHLLECSCGFGGDTGGGVIVLMPPTPPVRSLWCYRDEDFCRPTSCPKCGADVFFVRHNGGSAWFDELGWPWPKHGCFDDETSQGLRSTLVSGSARQGSAVFGVVIETVATRPGRGGRIVVRCSDGTTIDAEFDTSLNLAWLVGQLVTVQRGEGLQIRLVPVGPVLPR